MEPTHLRKITRNRELRVCTECRRRKLKCDRQLPCAACTRRNNPARCVYGRKLEWPQNDNQYRLQAEARLEHLESLVQELSQAQENVAGHSSWARPINTVQGEGDEILDETLHNGATHWSAMLEDIQELRAVIRDDDEIDGAGIELDGEKDGSSRILFGASSPLPFQQVLSLFLPPRHQVDRLVGAYFRTKAVAAPFLHTGQFRRQYQSFWDHPSVTSPLWTSILFSILYIASETISKDSAASTGEGELSSRFDAAAAYCLVNGEYYRPQRFSVEALLLYTQGKCFVSVDIGSNIAVLFGTLARLTMTMGYHRDADGYRQKTSVFEGEMRRRTWSLFMQLDMLVSFQLGIPSNTQYPTWDTRPPTNLLDSDFDENTVELPSARPTNEPTELLFYIAKQRLMSVFEKIIRHTLSVSDRLSGELEAIDQEIRDTVAGLPTTFQPRPIMDSVVDSPSLIVTRLCVSFIYQKCLCVLHRKYVTRGRRASLLVCYNSATDLVGQFLDMYKEFEPGGQLETERWFLGSITWHDFMLGCMALCLAVCYTAHTNVVSADTAFVNFAGSLELLQKAKVTCEMRTPTSKDTQRVRRLLEATILKLSGQSSGNVYVGQTSFSNGTLEAYRNATTSTPDGIDQLLGERVGEADSADDSGWAYLEQLLDLPDGDFIEIGS
ncbi:MAG: hypothetical protein LQ342_005358 [Letrouitia transgressa]|nr:MAG: hypothetical protein LQ342_005358 [Letrouitia transgressa]